MDEDSLFDMRRVHEQKERRGWGEVAVVDEDSLFDVTQGLGAGAAPPIIVRVQGFGPFGAPGCLGFGGLVQV